MAALLVEDTMILRPTPANFVGDAGVACPDAGNAEDALAILEDPLQRIDVLVTDLDLGAGNKGLALAIKARQRRPGLRFNHETGNQDMLTGRAILPRSLPSTNPLIPCPWRPWSQPLRVQAAGDAAINP